MRKEGISEKNSSIEGLDIFEDMNIFYRAVHGAIYKKLKKLPRGTVHNLLGKEFLRREGSCLNMYEHVPLLLDVMNKVEKGDNCNIS